MPVWVAKLSLKDIFHNDEIDFEPKRDEIVRRIKASTFWDENDGELEDIANAIGESDDVDEFDGVWDWFYDWADFNRVWVETR